MMDAENHNEHNTDKRDDDLVYKENIAKLEFVHNKMCDKTQATLLKIKNIDEKLNMILVFNAALFILFSVIFPVSTTNVAAKAAICIFIGAFVITEIATIVTILVALFPQKYRAMPIAEYLKREYYQNSIKTILEEELNAEWNSVKSLEGVLGKKSSISIGVMILSIVNIVLIMIAVLLTAWV